MQPGFNVAPADTSPNIPPQNTKPPTGNDIKPFGYGQHYINQTGITANSSTAPLVVFMGGTSSTPGDYQHFVDVAASQGFGAIGLAYANNGFVNGGNGCNSNPIPISATDGITQSNCFTQVRGEIAFGKGIAFGGVSYDNAPYKAKEGNIETVNQADSVINRLISLIDYLQYATDVGNNYPGYWAQFLVDDSSSPYKAPHDASGGITYTRPVSLNGSRIILAGHSQGGGHAAFIAMRTPTAVRRAVLLSAPQDSYGGSDNTAGTPAAWIVIPPRSAMSQFWGLRNDATTSGEGRFGNAVSNNWRDLGGGNLFGSGAEAAAGDGSTPPAGTQRFTLLSPSCCTDLMRHNSTGTDGGILNTGTYADRVYPIDVSWRKMLGTP